MSLDFLVPRSLALCLHCWRRRKGRSDRMYVRLRTNLAVEKYCMQCNVLLCLKEAVSLCVAILVSITKITVYQATCWGAVHSCVHTCVTVTCVLCKGFCKSQNRVECKTCTHKLTINLSWHVFLPQCLTALLFCFLTLYSQQSFSQAYTHRTSSHEKGVCCSCSTSSLSPRCTKTLSTQCIPLSRARPIFLRRIRFWYLAF